MTIRAIAEDLYRLQQKVEALEKKLEFAAQRKQDDIETRLREAKAERNRLRRILDGQLDRWMPYRVKDWIILDEQLQP